MDNFYQDSKFVYVGNDRYDGELFIVGSPVDRSITLNINGSCFDLTTQEAMTEFVKVITDLQELLKNTELIERSY
jgi:hypothetical protein